MSEKGTDERHNETVPSGELRQNLVAESLPVFHSVTMQKKEDDIQLDGPEMRSVALMGPPPMGLGGPRDIGSIGVGPLGLKPPIGLSKQKQTPLKVVAVPLQTGNQWLVPDDAPKPVPEHWVLERTSRFVGYTKASVVAERVAKCLQLRSITACFNGPKAKAKCFTDDLVEFRLKLYSGRGEYCHGIVIEVQKRSGSSILFRQECVAVLDAAEGIGNAGATATLSKLRRVCDLGMPLDASVREDSISAMESAVEMILKESEDSNLRGLESLVHLTDPAKSSKDVASFVAKELISSEKFDELRSVISSILQSKSWSMDEEEIKDPCKLQRDIKANAFKVLANSLCTMLADGGLEQVLSTSSSFGNDIVPILLAELKLASESPANALCSVKCLDALTQASPDAKGAAIGSGALDALSLAAEYGKAFHEKLAAESDGLAAKLQGVY